MKINIRVLVKSTASCNGTEILTFAVWNFYFARQAMKAGETLLVVKSINKKCIINYEGSYVSYAGKDLGVWIN